jgi:hypothetical protein
MGFGICVPTPMKGSRLAPTASIASNLSLFPPMIFIQPLCSLPCPMTIHRIHRSLLSSPGAAQTWWIASATSGCSYSACPLEARSSSPAFQFQAGGPSHQSKSEVSMNDHLIERAQDFIWRNARLLERQLFTYLFRDGAPEAVIGALRAYQNPDGGFGQALEPDKRCPDSQPVDVEMALKILDVCSALTDPQVQELLINPLCDFLASITAPSGGVPFALPSVNNYPHAPWWTTEANPPASLNPTASITGFLFKSGIQHPWLKSAESFCWETIAGLHSEQYHDLMPVLTFLANAPDSQRAQPEIRRILNHIRQSKLVELDPQAGGYVKMPLDWAPSPDSPCRSLFDQETIERHLNALQQRQQSDGGWPINWDPISPGVELEWRGWVTIEALKVLKAYGK